MTLGAQKRQRSWSLWYTNQGATTKRERLALLLGLRGRKGPLGGNTEEVRGADEEFKGRDYLVSGKGDQSKGGKALKFR